MTAAVSGLAERAAALRAEFDRGFAIALRGDAVIKQDLIAIRVGAEPFAIRLAEASGLFADRKITRVPGSNAALLGVAGFRGALVPVYSLRTLLGVSGMQAPRWLVIAAAAPVAFAFDVFEGHLRAPGDAILPQHLQSQTQNYAPNFIRTAPVIRPVLHLPSIVDALGAASAANPSSSRSEVP